MKIKLFKQTTFLIVAIVCFLLISCKEETINTSLSGKLKTMSITYNYDTSTYEDVYTYTYNSDASINKFSKEMYPINNFGFLCDNIKKIQNNIYINYVNSNNGVYNSESNSTLAIALSSNSDYIDSVGFIDNNNNFNSNYIISRDVNNNILKIYSSNTSGFASGIFLDSITYNNQGDIVYYVDWVNFVGVRFVSRNTVHYDLSKAYDDGNDINFFPIEAFTSIGPEYMLSVYNLKFGNTPKHRIISISSIKDSYSIDDNSNPIATFKDTTNFNYSINGNSSIIDIVKSTGYLSNSYSSIKLKLEYHQ